MRFNDCIMKKRDGQELSTEEINYMVEKYTAGEIPDYQMSAMLMAIFFQRMNERETADLTMAMARSGDMLDLSPIDGVKVDKHSTGGVGDKTSLVLGPMVAAVGVPVAKMSGRGLGHTGGTIDKLESIPGFSTSMDTDAFVNQVNSIKIALTGQTGNLAPADKKLYALRDVTSTVENISLIASSIMSKKIAAGADVIVLDVKTGDGAFMKNEDDARALAKTMVDIGKNVGRKTMAVISDMNQPLGNAVGNSLEVIEAIETLKKRGSKELLDLCLELGSHMVVGGKICENVDEAREKLMETISKGTALNKFREWIEAQGGDVRAIDDYSLLPQATIKREVCSSCDGYVSGIVAHEIGLASMILGGGREKKGDDIDLSVGVMINKKIGDFVKAGDVIAVIHGNDESKVLASEKRIRDAYTFSKEKVLAPSLIKGIIG